MAVRVSCSSTYLHLVLILLLAMCRLHVFFGCYHNLFRLMAKCGVLENLLLKEHTHTFVNTGVYIWCLQSVFG